MTHSFHVVCLRTFFYNAINVLQKCFFLLRVVYIYWLRFQVIYTWRSSSSAVLNAYVQWWLRVGSCLDMRNCTFGIATLQQMCTFNTLTFLLHLNYFRMPVIELVLECIGAFDLVYNLLKIPTAISTATTTASDEHMCCRKCTMNSRGRICGGFLQLRFVMSASMRW